MTTKLEYSDRILRASPGEQMLVVEPVEGVNMRAGGMVQYAVGDRLRVKFAADDLLYCLDDDARSVSFDRGQMFGLERPSQGASTHSR